MQHLLGRNYYELGDSVVQDAYPGCPATIIKIDENFTINHIAYWVRIDTTDCLEAEDENGDHENSKVTLVRDDTMDRLNPDMVARNC